MDRYTILVKGEVLWEDLSQLEYFEKMEDLAIEYYQTGSPSPSDIETKTIGADQVQERLIMATRRPLSGGKTIEATPKKTRQGTGQHTKYAASSRNSARKRYRGQGRQIVKDT